MALDPNDLDGIDVGDPRSASVQVASQLRAAILTKRLTPGERLPTQDALAERYGVARMTVQQALRSLRDDGLIVSRQGSGSYVRERVARPVGLRPHVEASFLQPEVSIWFSGYTAETLHNAVQEPIDHIRSGRITPESIALRILVSDMTFPLALPISSTGNDAESQAARDRMLHTADRYAGGLLESVTELRELGLVPKASCEIRAHRSAPLFKMYILNAAETFFGFYPVRQHSVTYKGSTLDIFDPMGKDAELFHYAADPSEPESLGSQFTQQAIAWFDSIWTTIAEPQS